MSDDLSVRAVRHKRELRTFGLELRSAGDGRNLSGRAAPYGSPAEITDQLGHFTERFEAGAFTRTIAERGDRVRLLANHDNRQFPLGAIERLYEQPDGLYLDARISNTTAGNDVLTLIHDRIVGGLSVGMQVVSDVWSPDYSERTIREAKLFEVSITDVPAYGDAVLTGVRSRIDDLLDDLAVLDGRPSSRPAPAGRSLLLALRELELMEFCS